MKSRRRILSALVVALAFGFAAGLFKGDSSGVRGAIGNLSAPWLLVGFLPAVWCRTTLRGAFMGFACTMVALVGFYAAVTLVLAGHLGGGGHGHEFLVEVGANRIYFLAGLVTGPLCGAAGSWIGSRHPRLVTLTVGGVMAGEIVVVALAQGHRFSLPPLYFSWGVAAWTPYIVECLLGVGLIVTVWAPRRSNRQDVSPRP